MSLKLGVKKLLCICALLILPIKVLANGGPVPGKSTGDTTIHNIKFAREDQIELIREDLAIHLREYWADVQVTYYLKNNGKAKEVPYSFPIDHAANLDYGEALPQVKEMKMVVDDKTVLAYKEQKVVNDEDWALKAKRAFNTGLSFGEKQQLKLTITYSLELSSLAWGTSKSPFVSYGTQDFSYNLSPAGFWGDGIVEDFNLAIYTGRVRGLGGDVNYGLTGIKQEQYKEQFDVVTLSKKNFDLKEDIALRVQVDLNDYYVGEDIKKNLVTYKEIKSIKASSTLTEEGYSYSPIRLIDGNLNTCWAEGIRGDGQGEWIEIEFNEALDLSVIGFAPGYMESKESFNYNGRVKTIKAEILYELNKNGEKSLETEIILIESKPTLIEYDDINKKLMYTNFYVGHRGEYYWKAKKVRFYIEDIVKGKKYQDTCISELLLMKSPYQSEPEVIEKASDKRD